MRTRRGYIPALNLRFLTPLYDPLLRWGMQETRFRSEMLRQAGIRPGSRVLDLGCGTATLTILVKETVPDADVWGIDGDAAVLTIGQDKAAGHKAAIVLDRGLATRLPYPPACFDVVLSSLVFHHLTREEKAEAAREVRRVLRSGGTFCLLDFGEPHNALARLLSGALVASHLERVSDNIKGLLPHLLVGAGFGSAEEVSHFMTIFGTLALYLAQ